MGCFFVGSTDKAWRVIVVVGIHQDKSDILHLQSSSPPPSSLFDESVEKETRLEPAQFCLASCKHELDLSLSPPLGQLCRC